MSLAFIGFYWFRQESYLPFEDFHSFWVAAIAVFDLGAEPYGETFREVATNFDGTVYPYVYPPPSIPLLAPLTLFDSVSAAAVINFWFSIFALLLVSAWTARLANQRLQYFWIGGASVFFFLGSLISRRELSYGQIDIYVILMMILAFQWRKRWILSGFFCAFAVLLKAYAVVLIPILLLDARYRATIAASFFLAASTVLVTTSIFPQQLWSSWFEALFEEGRVGAAFPVSNPWNASIHGAFHKLGFSPSVSQLTVFAILAVTVLVWFLSRRSVGLFHLLTAMALISMLPSIAWPQYALYSMPLAFTCAVMAIGDRDIIRTFLAAACCLVFFRYSTSWDLPWLHSTIVLLAANVTVWLLGIRQIFIEKGGARPLDAAASRT